MAIFDPAIFDNAIFDTPVAAAAASPSAGPGSGYGTRRRRFKRPSDTHVRKLSELDPKRDEPLFTPEEILDAPLNVDDATRAAIEAAALEAFSDVMDTATRLELQRRHYAELIARERELVDDEETFLMM